MEEKIITGCWCPLLNRECVANKCQWWVVRRKDDVYRCAIVDLAIQTYHKTL